MFDLLEKLFNLFFLCSAKHPSGYLFLYCKQLNHNKRINVKRIVSEVIYSKKSKLLWLSKFATKWPSKQKVITT